MLARTLRPQTFADVVGNEYNKELLRAVARNPHSTPSTLLFSGEFGCGKCITGDTYITVKHRATQQTRYIKVSDLISCGEGRFECNDPDFMLLTKDGYAAPSDIYFKTSQPTIRFTTSSGYSLEGTHEHPVLAVSDTLDLGYIELSKVRPGMVLPIFTPVSFGVSDPYVDPEVWNRACLNPSLPTDILEWSQNEKLTYLAARLYIEDMRLHSKSQEEHDMLKLLCESCFIAYHEEPPYLNLDSSTIISPAVKLHHYVGRDVRISQPKWYLSDAAFVYLATELDKLDIFLDPLSRYAINIIELFRKVVERNPTSSIAFKLSSLLSYRQKMVTGVTNQTNDVYDFTIPGAANFYSNGFISHNTTSARILAKAMNCKSFTSDLCCKCSTCNTDIADSGYYSEYDASMMGNVETVRNLRDTFYYQIPNAVRSVIVDEVHMASRQAMSALLKVFEEAPPNIKFLLCTTDADKLLPTIRSRSLEFYFGTQPQDVISKHIFEKAISLNIDITQQSADLIALRSRGHLRNAHMLLDQYRLVGADSFQQHIKSAKKDVLRYFVYLKTRDKVKLFKSIDILLTHPLSDLILDWQQTLLDILRASLGQSDQDETTAKVASLYSSDVVKLVKMATAPWVLDSFESDVQIRTALLALYQSTDTPVQAPKPQLTRNFKSS